MRHAHDNDMHFICNQAHGNAMLGFWPCFTFDAVVHTWSWLAATFLLLTFLMLQSITAHKFYLAATLSLLALVMLQPITARGYTALGCIVWFLIEYYPRTYRMIFIYYTRTYSLIFFIYTALGHTLRFFRESYTRTYSMIFKFILHSDV